MHKKCLIVEGGGFKTGFTSGVLDAFITGQYGPFDLLIGTSGGAVALSYYLSQQYRSCLKAIRFLANDKHFTNLRRVLQEEGYMDIDYLANVAEEKVPFLVDQAIENSQGKEVRFVATHLESGQAAYLSPNHENWLDCVIASSTLPFVTKGKHEVDKEAYFDGGWSDPLPVKWAYEQGAKEILVLRTWPTFFRSRQSWTDYFGSLYFNSTPSLKDVFANAFERYNISLAFMEGAPGDVKITQIAPSKILKSSTYRYTNSSIMKDYRYGLDLGAQYVYSKRRGKQKFE
jgi:predicted patatin/cPLA2 family phospholipase